MTLREALVEALDTFTLDPPMSEFQKGYLEALMYLAQFLDDNPEPHNRPH